MELGELRTRLGSFVEEHVGAGAEIVGVEPGTGHAGFSYLFDVCMAGAISRYYLRLPPPGVRLAGPADLHRQVTALRALDGTSVPHAPVLWEGDNLRWFGAPYFVVAGVDGITLADDETIAGFGVTELRSMAQQAMAALAEVHRVDVTTRCAYLGAFEGFEHEITRWDHLIERAADREELLCLSPRVRELLLKTIPEDADIGLAHGDFQFQNLMYSSAGELLAVIDWELCAIGPTLGDVGWITAFHDREAWGSVARPSTSFIDSSALEEWYYEALGRRTAGLVWFEALSLYKYAAITGWNLMLHRRGKRVDEAWEQRRMGAPCNLEHALGLLGG